MRDETSNPNTSTTSDEAMAERLARLAERRAAAPATHATGRTTSSVGPTARTTPKRRHAARGSRIAALTMSITTTASLTAFFASTNSAVASGAAATTVGSAAAGATSATTASAATPSAATAASTSTAAGTATAAAATAAAGTTAAAAAGATSTGLANGTYTGTTIETKWGPVQVQVTIAGGKLTDVVALQTPNDRQKSVSINAAAVPTLRTEALTAQSASIHTVSGATYTSDGYKQSLQSALDQATTAATATA